MARPACASFMVTSLKKKIIITRLAYWHHKSSYTWIKCIHSQAVRLFNQNHPGEEIFTGFVMSDQDLEWQWWVLLLPKQSVIKRRWCLSTSSTETSCLKGKFVYSTVVSTLLLNILLLPGAICSEMSRTALKYLNVWVTVPGEKEHPAWLYRPSFLLHLPKS